VKERGESEEQDEVSNLVDVANELAGDALKHVVIVLLTICFSA